jgi:hypothetical protein
MKNVAVITANLGNFDPPAAHILNRSADVEYFRFDDNNLAPRKNSMSPRLQAHIPKCFGWSLCPGFDYYIWVDASCAFRHPDSIRWFLSKCEGHDIALFAHPNRHSIVEEAEFMRAQIAVGNKYLTSRYAGEDIDGQLAEINSDPGYKDDTLYAATAFIYRNLSVVRAMLKEWWYYSSRYHVNDQLSLPYVVWKSGCRVNVIAENYLKIPYLTYIRNQSRSQ